ncbi:sensor histidine kinase [Persicitalea jodogahamensis]|uniref:Sensor histidine kinase n=1 Tax=Persicitalea jodogahamensis TaxID=402147 RepID=A0A8J3D541_9BACT|nr:histidine kinase [Persicitalea jodogahamensis]GHB54449.1 sensor histidine kinase [Persicitalea jodogahamensis]
MPWLIHVLVWTLLGSILLLWQPLTWQITIPMQFWIKQAVLFGLLLAVFYINTKIWIPRLLFHNRTAWFILLNTAAVLLVSFLVQRVEIWVNLRESMEAAFKAVRNSGVMRREDSLDYFSLLTALMMIAISTSVAAVQKWQHDAQLRQNLERAKTESELSFLKAQINPHFFFNTLNNIYALTVIDVEASREALHKLSRMMRYVLYDSQQGTVQLSQEIAFAQDYIKLMQLRLTDKVTVQLTPPNPMSDVPIAPMLFLPFIENAFKHGVSATQPSRIEIIIRQNGAKIHVEVKNTLFSAKQSTNLEESNGIGLVNTRRRLDLLYPGRYELDVQEDRQENEYKVHLELDAV